MVKRRITDHIPLSPDRISMRSLALKLGETERETRKHIETARMNGEIIDVRPYLVKVYYNIEIDTCKI